MSSSVSDSLLAVLVVSTYGKIGIQNHAILQGNFRSSRGPGICTGRRGVYEVLRHRIGMEGG